MFALPARLVLSALLLLLLITPAYAAGVRAQHEIERALSEEQLAGAVWSLIDGNHARIGGAGRSNMVSGERMRPDSRVQVGSVTKTLVALGILRLASENRLDLDMPVSRLLPEIAFANRWSATDPVRVRHLLDHSAGLEDVRLWQVFSAQISPDMPLAEVYTRDPSVLRIRTRPGDRMSYSNLGYTLAGMIIERVTGERYEGWLDRELLGPLGMTDSSFAFTAQTGQRADPRLAWGHNDDLSLQPAMPVAIRPGGQFTTTARDMSRLARFLIGDGTIGGRQLVRPDLLRSMGRPAETSAARAGLDVGNSLGLVRRDREGTVGMCHSGSVAGWYAMLCLYPDQDKAYFLAVNTDGEGANYGRLHAILMRSLALRRAAPITSAAMPIDVESWTGRYAPSPSRFEFATYLDLLFGTFRVEAAAGRLHLSGWGIPAAMLHPAGGHLFRAEDRVIPSHALLRDRDGTGLMTTGTQTYRMISPVLFSGLWASLALGLLGMIWIFVTGLTRLWRSRGRTVEPGAIALLATMITAALIARQPFTTLGDLTAGSVALWAMTAALPLLAAWQSASAFRRQGRWRLELAAGAAVLQLSAVLAWYGLLPLALWR